MDQDSPHTAPTSPFRIRERLILPFISVLVVLSLVSLGGFYWLEKRYLTAQTHHEARTLRQSFDSALKHRETSLRGFAQIIGNNPDLRAAWRAEDDQAMLALLSPMFGMLQERHHMAELSLHQPTGATRFQLHQGSGQPKPATQQPVLQQATVNGRTQVGLERAGERLLLRLAAPWYHDHELLGYISLAQDLRTLTDELAAVLSLDLLLVLTTPDKQPVLLHHSGGQWPAEYYQAILQDTRWHRSDSAVEWQLGEHLFNGAALHLDAPDGQRVGELIFIHDYTPMINEHRQVWYMVILLILVTGALLTVFYFYLSGRIRNTLEASYADMAREVKERRKAEKSLALHQADLEKRITQRTQELEAVNRLLKHDITQRQKAEQALAQSEERYRNLFERSADAMLVLKNNHFSDCNQACADLFGYPSTDAVIAAHPSDISPEFQPDGQRSFDKANTMINVAVEHGSHRFEWMHKRAGGEAFPAEVLLTSIPDKEGAMVHAVVRDITERKAAEAKIERQAYYDPLTELPNRSLFIDRLNHALAQCKRHEHKSAVLFLDLDRFKNINDSLGHGVGDRLLQQVADRIRATVREEDTAARLGGDEFVVLLNDVDDNLDTISGKVQIVAEKLRKRLAAPYRLDEYELHITPSIGIAIFPLENETVEDVLKYADTAMYGAKSDGRNTIRFYLPSMQADINQRLNIEKDLRNALRYNELRLVYQPQLDSHDRVVGAEALLRWDHPIHGPIPPSEFIPIAEESGLILPIGDWVLRTALAHMRQCEEAGLGADCREIAINVSPVQFRQADFAQGIAEALAELGTQRGKLTLEVTEGLMLDNMQDTVEKMHALKELGLRISIDDFGTGYSSLTYLKRLPIDGLKIDQSFVRDIATDPNDAAIVETIVAMARYLNLAVVAEGVENEEQFNFLKRQNCPYYQGYWFSTPLSSEAFISFVRQRNRADD